ncbi:hypothetical protein [Actinomyces vulturis]|uniref:hypothetical protein n=1 Tax=Actinomyces vulturis TaxID=1857645 RepID=UPI001146F300|nr:hypothetical protein [Actinomyces vulturis]
MLHFSLLMPSSARRTALARISGVYLLVMFRSSQVMDRNKTQGESVITEWGNLPKGKQPHVRVVDDELTLRNLYDRWTFGHPEVSGAWGPKFEHVHGIEDQITLGLRKTSKSGGLTIDLSLMQELNGHIPGKALKVHVK